MRLIPKYELGERGKDSEEKEEEDCVAKSYVEC